MNKKLLKAEMVIFGDTRATLAAYLGITPTTLSYKMNESHGRCFDKKEIEAIAERYSLNEEKIISIFF